MITDSKIYGTVPGWDTVIEPELAYVKMKKVKREGLGYDLIFSGTPTSRQVLYVESQGKLQFASVHGPDVTVYALFQH